MVAAAGVPLVLAALLPQLGMAQGIISDTVTHQATDAPDQRWGSAADAPQAEEQEPNTTVPASQRSRYPLKATSGQQEQAANEADVVAVEPEVSSGFDPRTSVELPTHRTADQNVYRNADGTITTEFSAGQLNVQQDDGSWEPVSTDLEAAGSGRLAGAEDPSGASFARRADRADLATVEVDSEHRVSFGLRGAQAVTGSAQDSEITYAEVMSDVDLTLGATGEGVKETLVLRSADAPTSYTFDLDLHGLSASLSEGAVVLSDESGQERARIPAGFMLDAGTSARGPSRSEGVTYSLSGSVLTVSLDQEWLSDPDRSFPVEVDPSVELPVRQSDGDSSMTVHGSSSSADTQELTAGYLDGANSAAYVKFNGLVDALQDHTIYGVQLSVVGYDAPSCKARPLNVYAVDESWSAGTGYSYPGPDVGTKLGSKSFAYGYIAQGKTSSACPVTQASVYDLGKAGRTLVQGWADGKANNGISLRAAAGDASAWKRIAGIGTANAPRLYVTHSPYDATYKITNPVPSPAVLQNQDGTVKIKVTNTGSETWTPSTYYLGYRVYDADGKAVKQVKSGTLSGNVAHGASTTISATIKALPEGQYFLDFSMVKNTSTPLWFTDYQVPPARISLAVYNVPPVVKQLYPDNGYEAPTLRPQLWAQAMDVDAATSALTYKFQICEVVEEGESSPACTVRSYSSKASWTVGSAVLEWSEHYQWQAWVKDANGDVTTEGTVDLFTTVPQPAVSANVAGAPNVDASLDVDPQIGNYTTSALDAPVVTTGPALNVLRTYNSLDPRRSNAFGAGWTTFYDMSVVPDEDGTGNVVVTYADGQQVRFGRNADGSYAPPTGRVAGLAQNESTGVWTLTDRESTTYLFDSDGRLTQVADIFGRAVKLDYTGDGKLSTATSVPNTAVGGVERSLSFVWNGAHVASVSTDPVDGEALTWTYTYDGDLLTQACAPGETCTTYAYADGSHYRTAVLEDRPDAYYRLGESDGSDTGSEVAINLGSDTGTYTDTTLGTSGAIAGSDDTAVTLNGTDSSISLPKGSVRRSVNQAVELWFRTTSGGPLIGYQDKALSATSTLGVPALYVGTDGKLRGQFATGSIDPITSSDAVDDDAWHHVVLSASGNVQTLYLDGSAVGTLSASIDQDTLSVNQVGAAYASTPGSWPGWGATARQYFTGSVDEVALYDHPLGAAAVAAHHEFATTAASGLSRITLPNGQVGAEIGYDVATDRVAQYTDAHGGTWSVGAPMVYGDEDDLRRSVEVKNAYGAPYLYEFDALTGQVLRTGLPTGLGMDAQYEPTPAVSSTEGDEDGNCTQPDPGDPVFCVLVPGDAGGPVFYTLDGLSVRTYGYDDAGHQTKITDENGNVTELGYDERGNVTSTTTCQTSTTDCHTEYSTYPSTISNEFDPRNDLVTQTRDGRSDSADDDTYLTTYSYAAGGNLTRQVSPDGGTVKNTYSNGAQLSDDGGTVPAGLPMSSTDPLGAVTKFGYDRYGDLTSVLEPSGLKTVYTYDVLGRKTSETEISDAYPDGVSTTFGYDGLSRMTSMTEPVTTDAVSGVKHQRRTGYAYDGNGNVVATRVEDLLGNDEPRQTLFSYDDHGNVLSTEDAEGNEISYEYDLLGNRTSVVDAMGRRYEYGYTARSALAQVRLWDWQGDPDQAPDTGEYLILHNYTYDLGGRLLTDTDAMGRTLEYGYNQDNSLAELTLKDFHDPDGSTRDLVLSTSTYDGAGNVLSESSGSGANVTTYTYTPTGQVATQIDNPDGPARRTAYTYDLAGNVTRTVNTGGTSNQAQPSFGLKETVTFDYDTAGRQIAQTVIDDNTGSATAGEARTTTYSYDERGLVVAQTDPRGNVAGADADDYTSTYTYDQLGRRTVSRAPAVDTENTGGTVEQVKASARTGYNTYDDEVAAQDPLGNITTATVDRLGQVVQQTGTPYTAPGSTSTVTPSQTLEYDAAGNVVRATDAGGAYVTYAYDKLDRLITQSQPTTDNDTRAVWHYTYDRVGEVLSVTDPRGGQVQSTYDDLDRPITSTEVERYPYADNYTTSYTYDDRGNLLTSTSPTGAVTTNTYDGLGQLTTSTDPSGVLTQFGYDEQGNTSRIVDGLGRSTEDTYNGFGQLVTESDLDAKGTVLRSQSYTYDAAGNLTEALSPLGTTRTYTYDALGQLTEQTEPTTASHAITTSFGYDANGNQTRYTDGRGNDTYYTYNTLGQTESVVEPSTPQYPDVDDRTWTASYDVDANPVKLVSPGGITRTREYDTAGRLTAESGSGAAAQTDDHVYGYDQLGQLTSVNAPDGSITLDYDDRGLLISSAGGASDAQFGYDGDGNLTSRTDAAGTASFTYTDGRLTSESDGLGATTTNLSYDDSGAVTKVDYGYGRVRSLAYDDRGRTVADTLENSAGDTVSSITYGYDNDDRMTSKKTTGTAGAAANIYDYDLAGRLTSWQSGDEDTAYGWDDSGNRVSADGKTSTFNARNQVQSDGDYTYTWSADGTLAGRTSSGYTEEFTFDAFERLIGQDGTTYSYDGLDRVASRSGTDFSYAGADAAVISDGVETYARGAYDELLAIQNGGVTSLALSDEHGDLVAGFDATNTDLTALDESTTYDPWGQQTAQTGTDHDLGYQGSWTDPDTDEVNMGDRWYNAATGSFDSPDPMQYTSGPSILANQYTYAAGDPMDLSDPDGNWPSCSWCSRAASAVSSAVSSTVSAVSSAVRTAASYTWRAVTYVASKAVSAVKTAAKYVAKAAAKVYNAGKAAVSYVANKVSTSAAYLQQKAAAAAAYAKQRAEAAKRAAIAHAKAVTRKAKAAVAAAVRHNPLPAVKALMKPVLTGLKTAVSATAKVPAAVVAVTKNVVADVAKSTTAIYQKAVSNAGVVLDNVSVAATAVGQFARASVPAVAGIAAGAATTVGCTFATGGAAAPACMVAGFAVGSAVTSALSCAPGRSVAGCAATGAAAGAVAGLVTVGTGGAGAGAGLATMLGSGAASGAAANAVEQYATTGSVDTGQVLSAAAVGGATAGVAHGVAQVRSARTSGMCTTNSFTAGTAVVMADGSSKSIEDVEVGDEVLATDPSTGQSAVEPVSGVIVGHGEKDLATVTVSDGSRAGLGTAQVTATAGHPFWVTDIPGDSGDPATGTVGEGRWVSADHLKAGDHLATAAPRDGPATIDTIREVTRTTTVYNLTIDGLHTYYVLAGKTPVLVHNCGTGNVSDKVMNDHILPRHDANHADAWKWAEKSKFEDWVTPDHIRNWAKLAMRKPIDNMNFGTGAAHRHVLEIRSRYPIGYDADGNDLSSVAVWVNNGEVESVHPY